MQTANVMGYELPLDRYYQREDHLWIRVEGEICRVGMDVLGQETSGDLSQLALVPPGTTITAGMEMGSLEAQKFVGSLRSPIAGTVVAINQHVLEDPRIVNRDPFGDGWLLTLKPTPSLAEELSTMVTGDAVAEWFEESVKECRLMGILAE